MSIGSILLCIFLFFIFRLLFRGFTFFRRINNVNKAYSQAYEDFMRGQRRDTQPEQPEHKKVITKDMGEYVAYEEITVEQTTTTFTDGSTTYTEEQTVTTEEQIVDAEWTDLPSK